MKKPRRKSIVIMTLLGLLIAGLFIAKMTVITVIPVIMTGSMVPTLPIGTVAFDVAPTDLKKTDIITFTPQGYHELVTHTFIGYGPNGTILTKGDANNVPDVWTVTKKDVVGKIAFAVAPDKLVVGGGLILFGLILFGRFTRKDSANNDEMDAQPQEETPVSTPV